MDFVAIDFETADRCSDSACAVGIVKVVANRIVAREFRLIRPPRQRFLFTYLHGISWEDVKAEPSFREVWLLLRDLLPGARFLAAHNARFDRSVLLACCRLSGLHPPDAPFLCTVRLARRTWRIYPTKLDNVCNKLAIKLRHHDALSDAEACARIVLSAASISTILTLPGSRKRRSSNEAAGRPWPASMPPASRVAARGGGSGSMVP